MHHVRFPYIAEMGKLQNWMDANDLDDSAVAAKVLYSRVHICRVRNGLNTSVALGKRLQKLTGIKWSYFVDPPAPRRTSR